MRFEEHALIAEICRESFYEFVKEFWYVVVQEQPKFNWHIKVICDELQAAAERVFRGEKSPYDYVINVPPGSTKSTICSQMFPAWVWTRMPHAKFICASHAYGVAEKDAIRCRDIVLSEQYMESFPEIRLREDMNRKDRFYNTLGGGRLTVGAEGKITGFHGHFILVDDPLDPEEAYSEADLKRINRWMETTLPTRKVEMTLTVTILIQQRLHEGDPSGEMLARAKKPGGKAVRHICLPGELYPDEELVGADGRQKKGVPFVSPPELKRFYKDNLLDPERKPREALENLKAILGAFGYASQVLQTPIPLGGGMFLTDKFEIWDQPPRKIVRTVRCWDKAGTEGGGKFTAGVKICVDSKGQWGILDVKRGQWGSTRREEIIKQTADMDGPDVHVILEVEGGSGGKESAEGTVKNLKGYVVHVFHPTGDKVVRAYAYASQVGAGNVWLLNREWTEDYVNELSYFPYSKFSDQVDGSSGGFNHLSKGVVRVGGW